MRFAFCLFRFSPFSGLVRDMLSIADEARGRGHEIRIVTGDWSGPNTPDQSVDLIPVRGLTNHGRAREFHHGLRRHLDSSRFDRVVGFNKIPGVHLYYAADPCFAARIRYFRNPLYRLSPRYQTYQRIENEVFGQDSGTHCLVLGEHAKNEYQEFYGTADSRFSMLPPNLNRDYLTLDDRQVVRRRVRSMLGIPDADLVVLMVGSGFRTKGVDRAVAAMGALPLTARKRTHLLVVGEGDPSAYVRQASAPDAKRQIRFLGGRSDVPELMQSADLLVHPAYNENTGTVLLEAMATGLPVLTTDVCGYAFHVRAADAGRVLPSPYAQHEFNDAMAKMLDADRSPWSSSAIEYGRRPDLYQMPERAVDAIESHPGTAGGATHKRGFFYLSDRVQLAGNTASFDQLMSLPGEMFRQAPGRSTVRFETGGAGYFLKTHRGVGWREILKNLFQLKLPVLGADDEWHALHFLQRLRVLVPAPLGFGYEGRNPARRRSFVLTAELVGKISLEEFVLNHRHRLTDLTLKRDLISGLAKVARTLHNNGVNHRDFYLCHFLIDAALTEREPAQAHPVAIYLLDLHRVQIRRTTPQRWIVKDLGGLYFSALGAQLSRTDLLRFVQAYSTAPLRQALQGPVNWDRVRRRALRLARREPHLAAGKPVD